MVKRRGPWSSSEDQRLVAYIKQDPTLNWVNISSQVESRTPKQCRERYHQNLKKTLNHSPITAAEGAQINAFVEKHGKRWADIARQLQGRSDNAVKNWWNGNQNRIKRAEQRRKATAADPNAASPVHALASRQPLPLAPAHHRPDSMQELVDAASMRRRDYYQPPTPVYASSPREQTQMQSQAHSQAAYYHQEQHHHHMRETAQYPLPHIQQHHQQHQQHQQQHNQYTQYAQQPASSYQLPPGPPSAGFDSAFPHHHSRRASIFADSPGADSVDHRAPSLVSDHGSPSVRGSSSHAWPSPTLDLPPLINLGGNMGSIGKPAVYDVYEHGRARSPAAMAYQLSPLAEPRTMQAAETILTLPKADEKRGGLGVNDLLN